MGAVQRMCYNCQQWRRPLPDPAPPLHQTHASASSTSVLTMDMVHASSPPAAAEPALPVLCLSALAVGRSRPSVLVVIAIAPLFHFHYLYRGLLPRRYLLADLGRYGSPR